VYGSKREPEYPAHALDGTLIGYIYQNGGIGSGIDKPEVIYPDEMAHWAPLPDDLNAGIGMSWVTPGIREIQGDVLATEHKIRFFENGATPNLVIKGLNAAGKEQFDEIVDMIEQGHAGVANAYKTLYLTTGADATVVGADMQQMAFKETQGAGETRIAMLSRVHPVVLAAGEGLAGSSLNAGNFNAARRIWGDTWIYPTLQDLCQALTPLISVPANAELWFDTADMPILREDAKDAAEITSIQATTIANLVKEGFTPESAIEAVKGQNMSLLRHTGLVSVQLQPPGAALPGFPIPQPALPALPAPNGTTKPNGAAP
jgi:phage portal protein BeeE